ncbi:MAG: diphthamide biosynthesis enzyme Dph2 [Thermoproteota archaeon]|jgi:2-(3-amino-3-carboxypropyl)histidine synthase|nr:diphthamide biosynthesis enzyme Dph2 [Thermoproteota archaeon]
MMIIDKRKVYEVINNQKPASVALNGPEGLAPRIQELADSIEEAYNIPAYVIGDSCWGSCDLNTHAADLLGVDILFNIGHTIAMESLGKKVVMINAYDDISFDNVARKCASELEARYNTLSLLTDSQHLNQIDSVKTIFEGYGYDIIIGRGKGQLNDAQVFGCEFYPAHYLKDRVDAYIFLGQSMFHAAGIAMSTERPTYMLDPYFQEYSEVTEFARGLQKKAILAIYNALDAKRIGLIIGLKEGQFAQVRALELKRTLEKLGKKVQLIALTEVTEERVQNFKLIDAFIQIACPRISTDNHFKKPMLSVPQGLALIKLLKNEPIEDFLKVRHWL